MKVALLIAAALPIAFGCGSDHDGGEAVIDGEVEGRRLTAHGAIALPAYPDPEGIAPGLIFPILISESPDACAAWRRNQRPRGSFILDLRLHDEGRESLRAGEYGSLTTRIWTGTVAASSLARMDASCKITSSYDGRSSTTVTLDRDARPGDSVSGRFQIAFGSDTITGTFKAAPCDARPVFEPGVEVTCGP